MAEMVKLFVNGQEVEVESGKNLIDAVSAVGIEIPHLCYHPALGADGNCRMCLVGIEDGRPPLVPACKTPAAEGMKVQLDAEHIKKIQRDVMELELINHPTDCPICDQAGECSLQDYYMKYDGQESRMTVPQVKKGKKLDFGCGVVHDQERCVVCGRCVRFTREITKTGELGIVNRTDAARVNIFPGQPLNNRYALNVVDLCPVGAMTSTDFRFKQRVWFLSKEKGICHGCSKGCNIFIDHNREKYKDEVIYRFRPRLNEEVNGYFICDEGRMTYKWENDQRLITPRANGSEAIKSAAVDSLRNAISQASKAVFLVSPSSSLEQQFAVKAFAEQAGATVLGFSDGYIKAGDGDDYLIQDDKAANRAGLALLGIDATREAFEAAMAEADLLVSFDNALGCSYDQDGLAKVLGSCTLAVIATNSDSLSEQATIAIPTASYSEYSGSIINCDNILQAFARAVVKNDPPEDIVEIVNRLGGELENNQQVWAALKKAVPTLAEVEPEQIPEQGLALTS
ncbi:2Fe-2S iron-sulfur cluster-binding protein [Desulfogranum mediterraneum]|uniref:2Fe-2S iron-sulfur cluster-binding protein n=1 Tax=Desulfogranum mediterraneum TaxID=160661 RepID=UPI0004158D3E|nr:2Fe-2S iron-sulfur cluster-binding protein [Desulfogranum mediterraneum]